MPRKPSEKSKTASSTTVVRKRGRPKKVQKTEEEPTALEDTCVTVDADTTIPDIDIEQTAIVEEPSDEPLPPISDEPSPLISEEPLPPISIEPLPSISDQHPPTIPDVSHPTMSFEPHTSISYEPLYSNHDEVVPEISDEMVTEMPVKNKDNEKQRICGPDERVVNTLNPPNEYVHVTNLVRPFIIPDLQNLISDGKGIASDNFWIDDIKSHCYVRCKSVEEATSVIRRLNGVQWPDHNPKRLVADYAIIDQMMTEASVKFGGKNINGHTNNTKSIPKIVIENCEINPKSLKITELFRKTKCSPELFWLPACQNELNQIMTEAEQDLHMANTN